MKVKELMQVLESANPNAEVVLSEKSERGHYSSEWPICNAKERNSSNGGKMGDWSDILLTNGPLLRHDPDLFGENARRQRSRRGATTMKVKELMEVLKNAKPYAQVLISTDQGDRSEWAELSIDYAEERQKRGGSEVGAPSDILIMQGPWLQTVGDSLWE